MDNLMVVHETHDYGMFKRLTGNRSIKELRVKKILRSIQTVGAIPNPIIVNEKMEVIDGQGRLEALKRLSQKVYYIVVPGLGINECRNMNIDQVNWTLPDYIDSCSEEGNENYERLKKLCDKYGKLGITVINYAVTGLASCDNKSIKTGNYCCDSEKYIEAENLLDYVMEFYDVGIKLAGRRDIFFMAIGFSYGDKDVNRGRLLQKVKENYRQFSPAATMEQMLDEISEAYNYKARDNRIYLKTDYQKKMESLYKWYRSKYGNKRDYLTMED